MSGMMSGMVHSFHQVKITVNGAKVRRAILNGRRYLVAPMTIIVPGVLNGSKGALYYPLSEIAKNASDWDWIPIVDGHPYVPGQGHVWATYPKLNQDILNQFGMGFCLKTNVKGKLKTEGWFDEEHTKRINPDVYSALNEGRPIEVSTGLGTEDEPAAPGSKCPDTGRPYEYIARNYQPDHLAVLTKQVGACSIHDGCGVLVNSDGSIEQIDSTTNGWITKDGGQHIFVSDDGKLDYSGSSAKPDSSRQFTGKGKNKTLAFHNIHHDAISKKFGKDVADSVMDKVGQKKSVSRDDIAKELKSRGLIKSTVASPYHDSNIVTNGGPGSGPHPSGRTPEEHGQELKNLGDASSHPDIKPEHITAAVKGSLAQVNGTGAKELGKSFGLIRSDHLSSKASIEKAITDKLLLRKGSGARANIGDPKLDKTLRDKAESTPHVMAALPRAKRYIAEHITTNVGDPMELDKKTIWTRLGEALGVFSPAANAAKKGKDGKFTGEQEREDDGSLAPGEDADEPPEGSLASVIQQGRNGRISVNTGKGSTMVTNLSRLSAVMNAEAKTIGKKTEGGTDTTKIDEEPPEEEIVDHEDDHQKPSQDEWADETTENAMPFPPPPVKPPQAPPAIDPSQIHEASKQASMATVGTAHEPAAAPAISAIQASKGGDSKGASDAHMDAAKTHDAASKTAYKQGDTSAGDSHQDAGALHRKAAMMHMAVPMGGGRMTPVPPPGGAKPPAAGGAKPPTGNNGGSQVAFNRVAAIKELTANCTCKDERAAYNKLTDATLQKLVGNDGQGQAVGGATKTEQAGGEEDADSEIDPDIDPSKPENAVKSKMGPEGGESTQNEAQLYANELYTQARNREIKRLTANIKDEKALGNAVKIYKKMNLNELRVLASSMPAQPQQQQTRRRLRDDDDPSLNFLGAGGGIDGQITDNDGDGFDKDAILPLPTMNDLWAKDSRQPAEETA